MCLAVERERAGGGEDVLVAIEGQQDVVGKLRGGIIYDT